MSSLRKNITPTSEIHPRLTIPAVKIVISDYLLLFIPVLIVGCSTTKPYIPSAPPTIADTFSCDSAITYRPDADIPQVAIDNRISGWVLVSYTLDGSGFAKNINIEQSDPPGVFDEKVIKGFREMRFKEGVTKDQCKKLDWFLIKCREDCPDFSYTKQQLVTPSGPDK